MLRKLRRLLSILVLGVLVTGMLPWTSLTVFADNSYCSYTNSNAGCYDKTSISNITLDNAFYNSETRLDSNGNKLTEPYDTGDDGYHFFCMASNGVIYSVKSKDGFDWDEFGPNIKKSIWNLILPFEVEINWEKTTNEIWFQCNLSTWSAKNPTEGWFNTVKGKGDEDTFVASLMNAVETLVDKNNDSLFWLETLAEICEVSEAQMDTDANELSYIFTLNGIDVARLLYKVDGDNVSVVFQNKLGGTDYDLTNRFSVYGTAAYTIPTLELSGFNDGSPYKANFSDHNVAQFKYLFDNAAEELKNAQLTSTESSVVNGIKGDYLGKPEADNYIIYYNASYALNYFVKKGNFGDKHSAFTKLQFTKYNPNSVLGKDMKPDEFDGSMLANLSLHQYTLMRVLGTKFTSTTDCGLYKGVPTDASGDGKINYEPFKTISVGTSGGSLTTDVITAAANEATQNVTGSTAVANAQSITSHYADLVKYVSVGFDDNITVGDNVNDSGEVNLGVIKNNAVLDTLANIHYTSCDNIQPKISGPLPVLKNVPAFTDNEAAFNAYLDIVYYTLVADSYMTAQYIKYGSGGYMCATGEEIKRLVDGKNQEYVDTLSLSSKQARFVKCVNTLYNGMTYLGIDLDYTDSIEILMSYQSYCDMLKNNASVDRYNVADTDEPMSMFFSCGEELLSDNYRTGVALSASYIPLVTNVYQPNSTALVSSDQWIKDFHYKYGFYRKALFIDNSSASAVDEYVTEIKGNQRIATLRDLFSPESDIVLYVDNNYYNAKELADKQSYVYEAIRNTETSGTTDNNSNSIDSSEVSDTLSGWASLLKDGKSAEDYYNDWSAYYQSLFDVDFTSIMKTGSVTEYSSYIFQNTTKYGGTKYFDRTQDLILWDDTAIDKYLEEDEYSVAQSFAVISSIYRNVDLFNTVNKQARKTSPVFISSPTLAAIDGISQEQFNTVYNYIMLKNLENNLSYDYKSTLDMDSPLFIDIYGNILTESGLVVIPAASNATLVNAESYTPWTAGFISLYAGDYKLPVTYNNSEVYMKDYFEQEDGVWVLKAKIINGTYMNFDYLPMKSDGVLANIVKNFESTVTNEGNVPYAERVYLITEVMRGAPLENISYENEGIVGNRSISKTGITMAYKLDDMITQFLSDSNGNSLVTLPNLAFMEGIEYVVLFLFKAMFAVFMLSVIITVYKDCVSGTFGIKSAFSGLMSMVIVIVGVAAIPQFIDYSYYTANKNLLKDDIIYIAMLNLEKREQGKEIGIGEVTEPESSTELYVKLDNISIPWYDMFDDVLLADTFDTATEMYAKAFEDHAMSYQKYVIQKANGLYVSVNDIFKTSDVGFSIGAKMLYQSVSDPNVFSYSTPYYVILDQLIANINAYNLNNNILNYNTEISKDGSVRTTGMIASYFLSEYFMGDNYDNLGFHNLYNDNSQKLRLATAFDDLDEYQMEKSAWFSHNGDTNELTNQIDELELYAKNFVLENKELLNKVSDETFLKVMSLQLALEHNRLTHAGTATTIEIMDIDSKDLLRLVVADKATVFKNSSYTFARFVYEEGGTFSVILMGCLTAVVWFTSVVKPALMLVILALLILSLFLRKMLFQKQSRAYEGYFISMGCFCGTNLAYALMLKVSINMTDWLNASPSVCILSALVVQVLYVLVLIKIISFQLKDWQSLGFNEYAKVGSNIVQNLSNVTLKIKDRIISKNNPNYAEMMVSKDRLGKLARHNMSGREILDEMYERDERKEENISNSDTVI